MKTKYLKKIVSVIATIFVAMGPFTIVTWAAPLPPDEGNLYIHKYAMDDTEMAAAPNNGLVVTPPASATPLPGIEFTITLIGPNSSGIYPETAQDVVPANIIGTPQVATTDNDGLAEFLALPKGVYLVQETNSAAGGEYYVASEDFLIAVPMTNAAGNGWLEDVHVYPKNQTFTPGKTANGSGSLPIDPSTEITWIISAPIPSDIATAKRFNLVDVMDSNLVYTPDSLEVYTSAQRNAATGTAVPPANYTETHSPGTNTLSVAFNTTGFTYLGASNDKYVNIKFKTTLSEAGLGLTIENNGTIEFTNDNDEDFEPGVPVPPKVYSGVIGITKLNADDEGLENAVFKVADSLANATNGVFLKDGSGEDLISTYKPNPPTNGYYEIRGISYGTIGDLPNAPTENNEFWLVEVQAPSGYSLLSEPVKVAFSYTSATEGTHTVNYINKVTIYNNKKNIDLPNTGSVGIILSTVLGAALLGTVAVAYGWRKSKKN